MKRFLSLVLPMLMACSLAGCAASQQAAPSPGAQQNNSSPVQTETENKTTAYFIGIMQGGAAWSAAQKGFEDACAELGWEGYYLAPATPNDTTEMVQLTETALTNGADVLIGTYYSVDIFGDVLKPAFEKGTYIATANCLIDETHQNFWIGTDPAGMGISQAEALASLAGDEKVTVVYMQTLATSETQNEQFAAFVKHLEKYPNITVWGQEYCDSSEVVAAEKISNLVKASPEINACVCADGNGALGVANFVDESGNGSGFYSVGIDDSADILNYVASGALDVTIAQDFYSMGYQSCKMIQALMQGGTVDFDNDSGTLLVTPGDVNSYAAEKGIQLS